MDVAPPSLMLEPVGCGGTRRQVLGKFRRRRGRGPSTVSVALVAVVPQTLEAVVRNRARSPASEGRWVVDSLMVSFGEGEGRGRRWDLGMGCGMGGSLKGRVNLAGEGELLRRHSRRRR